MAKSVSQIPGVVASDLNFASGVLLLEFDPESDPRDAATAVVRRAGHGIESLEAATPGAGVAAEGGRERRWRENRTELAVLTGGGLIVAAWLLGQAGIADRIVASVYALAILASGTVTWRRAWVSIQARTIDMNVLMSIAVVGAVALGEWSEAAAVIWLFALGGLLESRSLARTRRSIRELMDLAPPLARVRRGDAIVELPPVDVGLGETLLIRPGERIALDGTVSVGSAAIDESPITGESVPVEKREGDAVYAGSLATTGLVEVTVTATASDSTLARIVYLVEEAQASKAPSQRIVDRFTRWYTPAVMGLSLAVAFLPPLVGRLLGIDVGSFAEWFYRGLVVLVVSCPCALVISTPVAIVSAITRAARDGVLVKGGVFLELAGRVRAIAFDKTGTLTRGMPEVVAVVSLDGAEPEEAIAVGAALEANSTHPLARALVRAAGERVSEARVDQFADVPGVGVRGVIGGAAYEIGSTRVLDTLPDAATQSARDAISVQEAAGMTALVLVRDGVPLAVIGVADKVRAEAPSVMQELYETRIEHVVMLTGDNERTAEAVASAAGVRETRARLLPEEKTSAVRELQRRYGVVAMVGDGINDAPALAASDIGIAMGAAGSDTALETADVALMADNLSALPGFMRLGRRTVRVIGENVTFSIAVKALTLVLAVFGMATLWLAVFADMGVALLVIANSMRLLRREGRKAAVGNTS